MLHVFKHYNLQTIYDNILLLLLLVITSYVNVHYIFTVGSTKHRETSLMFDSGT